MPLSRCMFYDQAGNPINGGCKRLGRCEFVHPGEVKWESAPMSKHLPNNKQFGAGSRGGGRGRGRGGPSGARGGRDGGWGGGSASHASSGWGKNSSLNNTNASADTNVGWRAPSISAAERDASSSALSDWGAPPAAETEWGASPNVETEWGAPPSSATEWGDRSSTIAKDTNLSSSGATSSNLEPPIGWGRPTTNAWGDFTKAQTEDFGTGWEHISNEPTQSSSTRVDDIAEASTAGRDTWTGTKGKQKEGPKDPFGFSQGNGGSMTPDDAGSRNIQHLPPIRSITEASHPPVRISFEQFFEMFVEAVAVFIEVHELEEKRKRMRRMQKSRVFQLVPGDTRDQLDGLRNDAEALLRSRQKLRDELLSRFADLWHEIGQPQPSSRSENMAVMEEYVGQVKTYLDGVLSPGTHQACNSIMSTSVDSAPQPAAVGDAVVASDSEASRLAESMARFERRIDDLTEYTGQVYSEITRLVTQEVDDYCRRQRAAPSPASVVASTSSPLPFAPTGSEATRFAEARHMYDRHTEALARAKEDIETLKRRDTYLVCQSNELRAKYENLKGTISSLEASNASMERELAAQNSQTTELRAMLERISAGTPRTPTVEDLAQVVQRNMTPRLREELITCMGILRDAVEGHLREQQRDMCTRVWAALQPVLQHSQAIIRFMDRVAAKDIPVQLPILVVE